MGTETVLVFLFHSQCEFLHGTKAHWEENLTRTALFEQASSLTLIILF